MKLRRCVTCFTSCFVFSLQGGGLQKWKPLTQTPEPQRYNIPHLSLIFFFGLFKFFPLTVPSHEFFHDGIFLRKMIQGEQPHIGVTGSCSNRGTLIKAIVKGGYKYSLSLTPTDRCTVTVRLHVTSTCSCIQRKSCAASGGVLLCSLVKDAEKHRH